MLRNISLVFWEFCWQFLLVFAFVLPCELCQNGISCYRVSVRPSDRLSVTSQSCTKMAIPMIT